MISFSILFHFISSLFFCFFFPNYFHLSNCHFKMKPLTNLVILWTCFIYQFLLANASPVVSCAHNMSSQLSKPSSLPASTTPATFFIETSRSREPPSSTPTKAANVSAPATSITQAPNVTRKGGLAEKFVQTTYYSCVTLGTYTHCGWHEPILDASTSAAPTNYPRWSQPALWCLALAVAVMSWP